ncbi:MAG: multiheme c-type cytochrome [Myxococcota bacterium]
MKSSPLVFWCTALTLASIPLIGAACPRRLEPSTSAGGASFGKPSDAGVPDGAPSFPFQQRGPGRRVAVLYTASVQGYITPCGCTADPLGGVARLAAALDAARAAYGERVVFLDAGDLLFEKSDDNKPADLCQAEARIDLLLDTYARKGLAATVLGPLDDVRGAEFRDARLAARNLVTVGVSAAGRPMTAGAVHAPGIVVPAGEVMLGVTGFRADSAEEVTAVSEALRAEVRRLYDEGAHAVVALSQAPRVLVPAIVAGIEGLDVVVQGRDPGEAPREPERLGAGTFWVAAAQQAQHLGIIELDLEGRSGAAPLSLDDRQGAAERRARLLDQRIVQYEAQVREAASGPRRDFISQRLDAARADRARVLETSAATPAPVGPHIVTSAFPLVRGLPEDGVAKAALATYEQSIPALVGRCEAGLECAAAPPGVPTYVGVETCYGCHRQAVQFWQSQFVVGTGKDQEGRPVERRLSHATAWDTLVNLGKDKDRSCVACHSIGFNEPGGYCKTSEVDFRQNVQCEACHGPASEHVARAGDPAALVRRDVGEQVCRNCHHVPHIPTTESFVYNERLQHILGPGHGEARWRALPGKE